MAFQIRKDARKWFQAICPSSYYPLIFDAYYLCLMVGFASGRRNPEIHSDRVDGFVDHFPGDFQFRRQLLVGLLVNAELQRLKIDLQDREDVYREIHNIVEPDSPSYLSNEGMMRMNVYVHGGFEILCESLGDPPKSVEVFVRRYFRLLSDLREAKP